MTRRRALMEDGGLDLLAAEVEALEAAADVALFSAALAAGAIPADARRAPFLHELAAGTDFAALDRAVASGADLVAAVLRELRSDALDALTSELADLPDAQAAQERLLGLDVAGDPVFRELVADARRALVARLTTVYDGGRVQVQHEAARQGVALERGATALAVGDAKDLAQLDQLARRSSLESIGGMLRALRDKAVQAPVAGEAGDLVDTLLAVGRSLSDVSLVDAARQAAAVATGLGRQAAVNDAPAEPASIYASEILDRNVCGPCSLVDGTTYDSMAAARADYPNGLFKDCEGGLRCRGTLVYVWDSPAGGPAPPPEPPSDPRPAPRLHLPDPPRLPPVVDLVVDHAAVTDEELATARRQIDRLRRAVREKAATIRDQSIANLDPEGLVISKPPPLELVRDINGTQYRRSVGAAGGNWDWFYSLHPEEQARLRRTFAYGDPGAALAPDELVDVLRARYGEGSFDHYIAAWLDDTRRIDAAAAIGRGKIPSTLLYGGLDVDAVFGDGTYAVGELFGDKELAARSVAATTKAQAEEFAASAFAPAKLGEAPFALSEQEFIDEVMDLEESAKAIRPIRDDPDFGPEYSEADDWVLRRLAELIPAGIDDGTMALDELHQKIVALAHLAGLA